MQIYKQQLSLCIRCRNVFHRYHILVPGSWGKESRISFHPLGIFPCVQQQVPPVSCRMLVSSHIRSHNSYHRCHTRSEGAGDSECDSVKHMQQQQTVKELRRSSCWYILCTSCR